MLKKENVSPELIKYLSLLMKLEVLNNHRLVGGTALALQMGHRVSVDIDLFSDKKNDYDKILFELNNQFGDNFQEMRRFNSTISSGISVKVGSIKTDILDWNTKFIKPELTDEGIRMASKEDIIPMKFNTFLCDPQFARYEKKDFVDIAFLMQEYSLEKIIELYSKKYPKQALSPRLIIEGLQSNELADKKVMPIMINNINWHGVKKIIQNSIDEYVKKHIDQ